MDRVRLMQQSLEKHIKKRMQARDSSTDKASQSKGLLAPRRLSGKSRETEDMMLPQDRNLDIVADYILDIRKQKEEILNGKTITD